ncbi:MULTISPECIES: DUF6176 family protein [unclassified Lactobacillus]|uniref:DUF6176 family protein n=1 Tax=unclassified Lactobacillus TaxID=2620435 RepID=UPI0018DD0703|nr:MULTISPECIES: DUF6176 family protein [unclassified Lactobacillus]MBH9989787.1 hypothetical protein [Lactobacillus sp. M0392]MBI0024168.1 hypothetical protein [Lactobacillus sp. W8171]MBI0044828.1 hypothetical protein [Lactobacillus sp. M0393]
MTKTELTRFRIKKGKEAKAQEWMDFLNKHHQDTVATMAGERMYIETVFKEECADGYTYFYWYSMQGEGGNAVEDSDSYIDQKHLEYWDECIDTAYRPVDMKVMEKLVAPKIKSIMDAD